MRSGEGDRCECGCSEKVRVTGVSVGAVRSGEGDRCECGCSEER